MHSRIAAAVAAVALTATLAGCNFTTPQATLRQYDPADGTSGSTGLVDIRNAVLVAGPETASFVVTFVNDGPSTMVSITVDDDTQELRVQEGLSVFGFDDDQLVFDASLESGTLSDVVVTADGSDRAALSVPVYDTSSANWASYGPPGVSASPEPSHAEESDEGGH